MKKLSILLGGLGLVTTLAQAADITGTWRTIDDKTGYALAYVNIEPAANNTYKGTILDHFPFPGQKLIESCQKCPAPYTDQRIKGLQIINNLVEDPEHSGVFQHGKILDPLTGRLYSLKAKLSPDGRRLRIRGYLGAALVGRSQTWLRLD